MTLEPHHVTRLALDLHSRYGATVSALLRNALGRCLILEGASADSDPTLTPLLEAMLPASRRGALLEDRERGDLWGESNGHVPLDEEDGGGEDDEELLEAQAHYDAFLEAGGQPEPAGGGPTPAPAPQSAGKPGKGKAAGQYKVGVPFQGPSGRWFVLNQSHRVVPAKNPNAQPKQGGGKPAGGTPDPNAPPGSQRAKRGTRNETTKSDLKAKFAAVLKGDDPASAEELASSLMGLTANVLKELGDGLVKKLGRTKAEMTKRLADAAVAKARAARAGGGGKEEGPARAGPDVGGPKETENASGQERKQEVGGQEHSGGKAGGQEPGPERGDRPERAAGGEEGGRGEEEVTPEPAPAAAEKPPAAPAMHPAAQAKADEFARVIGNATHLTDEQKRQYFTAAHGILSRMSPKAAERFAAHQNRPPHFAADLRGINEEMAARLDAAGENTRAAEIRARRDPTGGCYIHGGGQGAGLILDGNASLAGLLGGPHGYKNSTPHVYAHEFAHAIDGPKKEISNSPEWQEAAKEEIRPDTLTRYAATKPSEGFAEFGRLLYAGSLSAEDVRQKFPKCYAVWEKHGILPVNPPEGGAAERLPEVFSHAIDLPGGSHADVLAAPTPEPAKAADPLSAARKAVAGGADAEGAADAFVRDNFTDVDALAEKFRGMGIDPDAAYSFGDAVKAVAGHLKGEKAAPPPAAEKTPEPAPKAEPKRERMPDKLGATDAEVAGASDVKRLKASGMDPAYADRVSMAADALRRGGVGSFTPAFLHELAGALYVDGDSPSQAGTADNFRVAHEVFDRVVKAMPAEKVKEASREILNRVSKGVLPASVGDVIRRKLGGGVPPGSRPTPPIAITHDDVAPALGVGGERVTAKDVDNLDRAVGKADDREARLKGHEERVAAEMAARRKKR